MTDLLPLRESSESSFERALLQSADRDAPSERAFAKTAAALGVGGALVGTAGNAVAGVGAATWVGLTLKPMLMGALGGLLVAVSAHRLSAPSEAPRPAPVSTVASAPRVRPVPPRATPTPPVPAAFDDETSTPPPLPRATASERSRAASPTAQAPEKLLNPPVEIPTVEPALSPLPPGSVAPNASASIASEVSTIDRARHALRDGRPSDALHDLDLYRATWPRGVLATEAAVLRIEAHLALGDRASGIRAARAFLAANPSGRYAARVRELFNSAELE